MKCLQAASGLYANYCMFIDAATDDTSDDKAQLISATIELLQRKEAEFGELLNMEFGHRLLLGFGSIIQSSPELKELAVALGAPIALENIIQMTNGKLPKVASLVKEVSNLF